MITVEELSTRYGQTIGSHLFDILEEASSKRLHSSHFRVCEIGNAEEELLYEEISESGCCGEWEIEHCIGERHFRVGFNYGH